MLTQCLRYPTYSVLKTQKMASRNCLRSLLNTSKQISARNYSVNSMTKYLAVQNTTDIDRTCNKKCLRLYSDIKDDETLKSWIKEIKDDFENSGKESMNVEMSRGQSVKLNASSSDNLDRDIDLDNLHSIFDNNFDKLEKLGFTTEEIIDLLKQNKSQENDEFEDSDTDHIDDESQAEESVTLNSSGSTSLNEDSVHENLRDVSDKLEDKKWAVVEMNTSAKTDWSAEEIEDFVNIAEASEDTEDTWELPVNLIRGENGVFEIEELIAVLKAANAQDIMAIKVPEELNFADYMVIVSARSLRHMKAILADIKWIHKRKKSETDKYMRIEGADSEWCAADLGNIVLHVFLPASREVYDLETLWTVGAKFDPQCAQDADPYTFSVAELPWLKELEQDKVNPDRQKS